jgi:predicted nucleic acid-binding Zn ribbon protein
MRTHISHGFQANGGRRQTGMKYCPACGEDVPDGSATCPSCGRMTGPVRASRSLGLLSMALLALSLLAVVLRLHWAFALVMVVLAAGFAFAGLGRSSPPARPRRLKKRRAQVAWVFGSIALGLLALAATAQALGYRMSAEADMLVGVVIFMSSVIATIAAPSRLTFGRTQLYRSSLEKPEEDVPPASESESDFWADVFPDAPDDEV